MARIRTIKPMMFKSFTVCSLPFEGRWLFAGLFTYCDDDGRGVDDARLIKAELFALDEKTTAAKVEKHLTAMATEGDDPPICRYQGPDGRRYLHFPKWKEHQRISHPAKSTIPACPLHWDEDLRSDSGAAPEPSGKPFRRNKEGNKEEE